MIHRPSPSGLRIIIGSVISMPPYSPGMAWNWMHHAEGLRRLGHDVYFVEEVTRETCVDEQGQPCPLEHSVNLRSFRATMEHFGFLDRACLVYAGGESTFGMSLAGLAQIAQDADLLLNISGHVKLPQVVDGVRRRVYMDQDPVYTQLWRAEYGLTWNLEAHDVFVTVGLNIGTPHTEIPDCDRKWHYALPPVVLDLWPAHPGPADGHFTTIGSWWAGLKLLRYRGELYGSKADEFKRFAELPRRVGQRFEAALRQHDRDAEGVRFLRDHGWLVTESSLIGDLTAYQGFIGRSRAEIGIAKNAYVKAHSGWFSDRTAHYLAHGRPALAQSTGFERHVPTGKGLLCFATLDEAVDGVERINRDYEAHCRAAREIAEEFLDHRKVLPKLLDDCTASPDPSRAQGVK